MSNKQNEIIAEAKREARIEESMKRAYEHIEEDGYVNLFRLPRDCSIKIYEKAGDGSKYIVFHHLDGMYSFCTTEKGAVVHVGASQKLRKYKDGFRFYTEPNRTRDSIAELSVKKLDDDDREKEVTLSVKLQELTHRQLEIQRDNYIEMVSEQLDEKHEKFLGTLLSIVNELHERDKRPTQSQ